ncbi:MAG: hypothetical protein F6J94_12940 [Moorea sp. SIO1F2]|nr:MULTISPECIES: hypothetical protein [unclassified Moorena]NEN96225.1 hypothetical protein [Moorena sp. SIO3I7]NEO60074.1 hypothetical protein [Moorena sp. SIO4G2]NEO04541.1 hypothetical protein [Moorena sp. SIO3I8]NEO19037.1 hypothetical protein [Moorena sp. SIO4A5]NEP26768.1 hypothetical protein [Moorena sp. SIO3I6]
MTRSHEIVNRHTTARQVYEVRVGVETDITVNRLSSVSSMRVYDSD